MAEQDQPQSESRPLLEAPPSPCEPSAAWSFLIEQFPGHPALSQEAIYVLPPKLINLINSELPGFFDPDDIAFERELAGAARLGFFRRQPICYPPLAPSAASAEPVDDLDKRSRQAAERIQLMLEEGLRKKELTEVEATEEIKHHFDEIQTQQASVNEWQLGYAGWLATSSDFRAQRNCLRDLVANAPGEASLPQFPRNYFPGLHFDVSEEFRTLWHPFYEAWALERLATWDLPLPLLPEITAPNLHPIEKLGGAGVLVFLPWYLLRARNLNFVEMAKEHKLRSASTGLREWLERKEAGWGEDRYQMLFKLYIYLELALNARYRPQMKGNVDKFDRIFAELLISDQDKRTGERVGSGESSDTIKKIRLHMNKRLK